MPPVPADVPSYVSFEHHNVTYHINTANGEICDTQMKLCGQLNGSTITLLTDLFVPHIIQLKTVEKTDKPYLFGSYFVDQV